MAQNPRDLCANLRVGVLLSWAGMLDSSLIFLSRARAKAPGDSEIRLIQARTMAWNREYDGTHLRQPFRPTHDLVMDSERIRGDLGFAEPMSEDEGLYRTIRWEEINPPAGGDPTTGDYAAEDAVVS